MTGFGQTLRHLRLFVMDLSENNAVVHAMLQSNSHFTEYSVMLTVQPEERTA